VTSPTYAVIVDGVNFCVRLTRRSPGDVVFTIEIEGCCVGEVPWDNLVKANTRIDPDYASAPEKQIRELRSDVARLRGEIIDQDVLRQQLRDAKYAEQLAESELAHLRAVLKPQPEPRLPEIVKHVRDCPLGWAHGHVLMRKSATEDEVIAWLQRLHALASASNDVDCNVSLPRPPRKE